MADEFKHIDVGAVYTRAEFEALTGHVFNNQAAGDIMYASSNIQLSRLGIGAGNTVLHVAGGLPVWSATLAGLTLTAPIINGIVTTTGLTLPAFTMNGTIITGGNVFDAGAGSAEINTIGALQGLTIDSSHGTHGVMLNFIQSHTTPDLSSIMGRIKFSAYDHDGAPALQTFGNIQLIHENIGDGTERAGLRILLMDAGVPDNQALTLSSLGALWLDADITFSTSIDSALVADEVSLGCFDIGGLRSLAISQENPVVTEAIGASDRTLPVRINGTDYKIMLHT